MIPIRGYPGRMPHWSLTPLHSVLFVLQTNIARNEGRFTPILNNSQEKGLRIFNKPSFYEARLTFFLDSVEYYKLSGVHLRTFYLEQRHGLSTFYII